MRTRLLVFNSRWAVSHIGKTIGLKSSRASWTKGSAPEQNQSHPYTEEERLKRDRINILSALKATNGQISGKQGAAELLGIKPTTLKSRMGTLGIEKYNLNI